MLYLAGGKVYVAGRSEEKAHAAILTIEARSKTDSPPGELHFLPLDLSNLTTIKPAVQAFMAAESRLDVLFNNAGVSLPPRGSRTAQGNELQMGTNCLGHYLLTQLFLPALLQTAEISPKASVRVIWTSSIAVDISAPQGGIVTSELTTPPSSNQQRNYLNSKTGNWFLAGALAREVGDRGILSVTQNPGNLKTGLLRHAPWILGFMTSPLLYSGKMGAYTALWAGLSGDLSEMDGGGYVVPWGRLHPRPRQDLLHAVKMNQEEGQSGVADAFMQFCDQRTKDYR